MTETTTETTTPSNPFPTGPAPTGPELTDPAPTGPELTDPPPPGPSGGSPPDGPPPDPPPGGPPGWSGPSPASEPGRLVRDPDERVVAGVCAAFGRYTDTDPVLWRVSVAVLTLFGGAGLVLYVLGWLLVPRRGEPQSALERAVRRQGRSITPAGVLLAVGAAVALLVVLDDGPGPLVLLVLGVVAWLVARERRDPASAASAALRRPTDDPLPAWSGLPDPATTPYGADLSWDVPPPPRRRRSRLGRTTLSAAVLVTGALLALRLAGLDGITAPRIVAAALLVVGAGLVVGTWVGRARWLLPVGALLVVALGVTSAASGAGVSDGLGERRWAPTGADAFRLGVGEGVLDLRELPDSAQVPQISAGIGAGSLVVLVPEGLVVDVRAEAGRGRITWPAADDRRVEAGEDDERVQRSFRIGTGPPDAELDLEVGLGRIEVRRVAA